MRLMCRHARHARAQTLNRNGIAICHCKTHIKLDLALEPRVRGGWADQDIVLITSIYASQVPPCSNNKTLPRCYIIVISSHRIVSSASHLIASRFSVHLFISCDLISIYHIDAQALQCVFTCLRHSQVMANMLWVHGWVGSMPTMYRQAMYRQCSGKCTLNPKP